MALDPPPCRYSEDLTPQRLWSRKSPQDLHKEHKMTSEEKRTTKIAIVTGGSRGLGRSTVLSLAKRGISSIFTYNANRAEAEKVVGLVAQAGGKAVALQLDAGD